MPSLKASWTGFRADSSLDSNGAINQATSTPLKRSIPGSRERQRTAAHGPCNQALWRRKRARTDRGEAWKVVRRPSRGADAGDRTKASHQAGGCSSTELHPRGRITISDDRNQPPLSHPSPFRAGCPWRVPLRASALLRERRGQNRTAVIPGPQLGHKLESPTVSHGVASGRRRTPVDVGRPPADDFQAGHRRFQPARWSRASRHSEQEVGHRRRCSNPKPDFVVPGPGLSLGLSCPRSPTFASVMLSRAPCA